MTRQIILIFITLLTITFFTVGAYFLFVKKTVSLAKEVPSIEAFVYPKSKPIAKLRKVVNGVRLPEQIDFVPGIHQFESLILQGDDYGRLFYGDKIPEGMTISTEGKLSWSPLQSLAGKKQEINIYTKKLGDNPKHHVSFTFNVAMTSNMKKKLLRIHY